MSFTKVPYDITSKPLPITKDGIVLFRDDSGGFRTLDIGSIVPGDWQPLSANLTAISGLTLTDYGKGFLSLGNASLARTYLGLSALYGGLGGGSSGQILRKTSTDPYAYAWSSLLTLEPTGAVLTPALSFYSLGAQRQTKRNLKLTVNVRDYGATGDGSTNDRTAINLAIADLTDHSVLYFPAGKYRITSALNGLSNLTNVTVMGDGLASEIFLDAGAVGDQCLVVATTCAFVTIKNLSFTDASTARSAITVCIRLYSDDSSVENCYFSGMANFAIHLSNDSGTTWGFRQKAIGNTMYGLHGDGIHVGAAADFAVSDNIITLTGDDAIAVVADDINHVPTRGVVSGNEIYSAGGIGTAVGGCGIRVAEAIEVLVDDNVVDTTYESGIRLTRYQSITAYNTRVTVSNNILTNCGGHLGSNTMDMMYCASCTVENNKFYDGVFGVGVMIVDLQDSAIKGNTFRNIPTGGIRSDTTTLNVAVTWDGVVIKGNDLIWILANEAIYVVPGAAITVTNLLISENYGKVLPSGIFIYYDQINTGRVVNNTRLAAATISAGGTVAAVTTANNN